MKKQSWSLVVIGKILNVLNLRSCNVPVKENRTITFPNLYLQRAMKKYTKIKRCFGGL